MPFPGEGVWLVNWLGNWVLEGGIGSIPKSGLHTHTPYRLDKLRSALAEMQLKSSKTRKHFSRMSTTRLPTVGDLVATTRCQYQVVGYRSHVHGVRVPTRPIPCPCIFPAPWTYTLPPGPIPYPPDLYPIPPDLYPMSHSGPIP